MWSFLISVACYCALGSHPYSIPVGPFPTKALCEQVRLATAHDAAECGQEVVPILAH